MSDGPRDIALRLVSPTDSLDQLRAHPQFRARLQGPITEQASVSTYFDLDDFSLRRRGLTLRIRQIGPHRIQTLTSVDRAGSPYAGHTEAEQEIAGDVPDLGVLQDALPASLLDDGQQPALRPMFETKMRRKAFRIEQDGAEIDVALNTGEVIAAGSVSPVSEIALQLKSGDPGQLFALAKAINTVVPVELELQSKTEIGFRLLDSRPVTASLAPPIELDAAMTVADGFKAIARACLRHLAANYELVQSRDPKAVHQTRVALRRLRVAISAFSRLVADGEMETVKARLKHFAQQLGPARDLDVLVEEVLKPFRAAHPKDKGALSLVRSFMRQRDKAHDAAAAAVTSGELQRFILDCAAWVEAGAWTRDTEPGRLQLAQRPIAIHAADQIRRRRRQCRKLGSDLDTLSDDERHQVRISVKKLRYTLEFFGSLYGSGARHRRMIALLRACQKLQDSLGGLNDLAIRRGLFAKLLLAKSAGALERAFSAGMLLGSQEHEVPTLRKRAAKAWKAIHKAKSFWKVDATAPPGAAGDTPGTAAEAAA